MHIVPRSISNLTVKCSRMASESEGESDALVSECQTPGCGHKGLKEEVRFRLICQTGRNKLSFILGESANEVFDVCA